LRAIPGVPANKLTELFALASRKRTHGHCCNFFLKPAKFSLLYKHTHGQTFLETSFLRTRGADAQQQSKAAPFSRIKPTPEPKLLQTSADFGRAAAAR